MIFLKTYKLYVSNIREKLSKTDNFESVIVNQHTNSYSGHKDVEDKHSMGFIKYDRPVISLSINYKTGRLDRMDLCYDILSNNTHRIEIVIQPLSSDTHETRAAIIYKSVIYKYPAGPTIELINIEDKTILSKNMKTYVSNNLLMISKIDSI